MRVHIYPLLITLAAIRVESNRDEGESKAVQASLKRSERKLAKLVADLAKGADRNGRSLEVALARAGRELALLHYQRAVALWAHGNAKATGRELLAAAETYREAARWAGLELEAGARASLAAFREVARKLVDGAAWTGPEVEASIREAGGAIGRLARNGDDRAVDDGDGRSGRVAAALGRGLRRTARNGVSRRGTSLSDEPGHGVPMTAQRGNERQLHDGRNEGEERAEA